MANNFDLIVIGAGIAVLAAHRLARHTRAWPEWPVKMPAQ